MSSLSKNEVHQNDFIIFQHNSGNDVIDRIISRPHSSVTIDDLLVVIYSRIPPRVHLLGAVSTFGLTEVAPTDQQVVIRSDDILDFCFIFDIETDVREKVHIQGIKNTFIIDSSSYSYNHHPFRHGHSSPRTIFCGLQCILKMNDSIMNNMKSFQTLCGKQQSYLDEITWKYILSKVSNHPNIFEIYSKSEFKISRRTHWDLKRQSLSHACRFSVVQRI